MGSRGKELLAVVRGARARKKRRGEREKETTKRNEPEHIRILSPSGFESVEGVCLFQQNSTSASRMPFLWNERRKGERETATHRHRQHRPSDPEPSCYHRSFRRDESRKSDPRGTVNPKGFADDCFEVGEGFDLRGERREGREVSLETRRDETRREEERESS